MLVHAAFTPHTPLLLPSIGKENVKRLQATTDAMKRIAEDLYVASPETIVIVSAHSAMHPSAFSVNLHDAYEVDLSEFGDLGTAREFLPDIALIDTMQRSLRRHQQPLTLDSDAALDYGTAVPLLLLTENLRNVRIVPISYSGLDAKAHFTFGRALKHVLADSSKRIALIASGDLSHALSSEAPAGHKPEGEQFDRAVRQALEQHSASALLTLDPAVVEAASECAYRPLLVFLGALERTHVDPEVLSYESPFGVGYLAAQFHVR